MTKQRRAARRDARELAEHNRVLNLRKDTIRIAKSIKTPAALRQALMGFEGVQRIEVYETLKPYLGFVPAE